MKEIARITIPLKDNKGFSRSVRSLCWHGDNLVDWVGGGVRYGLDGKVNNPHVNYAYRFDHAVTSQDGTYVALLERLGTKGLLLKHGKIIREVNRSFYHAHAYEYPLAFITLPDGKTGVIHCPEHYCKLEIEEVEPASRLTQRDSPSIDFFYSRLSVSFNHRYLVSAGWVWHPFDSIGLYDVEKCLDNPSLLDSCNCKLARTGVEINAAIFGSGDNLLLTTHDDYYDPDDVDEDEQALLGPNLIVVYDVARRQIYSQAPLQETVGTLMPLDGFAVGFYQHPKLIDLSTGQIIVRWENLWSGEQTSSIMHHIKPVPPLAFDPAHKRFAVASEDEITVIMLG